MEAYLQYLTDDPAGQQELERQLDLRGLVDRARKDILKQLELASRSNQHDEGGSGDGDDTTAAKDESDPSKSVAHIQSEITRYILESKTFQRIVDKDGGRAIFRNLAGPLREEVSLDTYAEPDIEDLVKQCISSSTAVRDLLKADLKVVIKDLWTTHSSGNNATGKPTTTRTGSQSTKTSGATGTVHVSASTSAVKTEKGAGPADDGGDLLQTILQTAAKSKATHKGVKRGLAKEADGNSDGKNKKKAKVASSSTSVGVKGEMGGKGHAGAAGASGQTGPIRAVDVCGAELSSDDDST